MKKKNDDINAVVFDKTNLPTGIIGTLTLKKNKRNVPFIPLSKVLFRRG